MAITVYCVGIFFNKSIDFVPDLKNSSNELAFMSGESILKACAALGLRYQLTSQSGQISYLSYTPTAAPTNHTSTPPKIFPFIGQPLNLIQTLRPVGEISNVFQYTASQPPLKPVEGRPSFKVNGFRDGSDIRIRLLSIHDPVGIDDLIT